jgi:hypothetical protein
MVDSQSVAGDGEVAAGITDVAAAMNDERPRRARTSWGSSVGWLRSEASSQVQDRWMRECARNGPQWRCSGRWVHR